MANTSAKEASKLQARTNRTNMFIILALTLWQIYAKPGWFTLAFFCALNYLAFSMISQNIGAGMTIKSVSHWFDVFYLNAAAMFLHPFTKWAWAAYALAFGLLIYHYYKMCKPARDMWSNMSGANQAMMPEQPQEMEAPVENQAPQRKVRSAKVK